MLFHVVKSGETLSQIAGNYGVTVSNLANINGLPDPNRILIGQALIVPTEDVLYTVRYGDTLWKIAQAYKTTISAIIQENKIADPSNIYPGLKLYISAPRHTIRPGETLSQIAAKYGVSLETLIKVNNIENPDLIYSGAVLVIPQKQRPVIETNGYIYLYGESGAEVVRDDGRHLTYLSPFAYRIREDGDLEFIWDEPEIKEAYAKKAVPVMSVTNFTSTELGQNLAHVVLGTSDIRNRTITNIVNIMRQKGYKGLNIDFENVLPADRELYNNFIKAAADALHMEGFFISSALAPKTGPGQSGVLYEAHDYPSHGRIMDFVILMTYEWGYRLGPARAISPLDKIKLVLDYAVSVIPRDKIFFGFQLYARDWVIPFVKGTQAETISVQEALLRATSNNASIQYDKTAESPFYRYMDNQGRQHEVWFEDARSAQAKFDTVKQYKLRGISYWTLGYPFPQNWVLLEDNFNIKKLI